jgi:hypothetical protein
VVVIAIQKATRVKRRRRKKKAVLRQKAEGRSRGMENKAEGSEQ